MRQFLGLLLLLAGFYFLGQNIIFSTASYPYFWRSIPAIGSVLLVASGIASLILFPRQAGSLGWILLILGVVLVFLSGGVLLKPTSLWSFTVAFGALLVGYRLLTERHFRL